MPHPAADPATQWMGAETPPCRTPDPTPPPAASLPAVPGYTLVRPLGRGGMGAVYEADQHDPPRRVAVKLIARDALDPAAAARFAFERQAVARMDHPNVARVFDTGTTAAGVPFFAMELVNGPTLGVYCRQNGPGVRARLALFVGVCRAVQHAHQKGVIHRDLKPGNILVTEVDGQPVPKVIDFGVAKLMGEGGEASVTRFGLMAGTPLYMAPEQADPLAHVDTRADVYALGVVLFELLTGTTPLDPTELNSLTADQMLRRVSRQTPVKPSVAARVRGGPGGPDGRASAVPAELDWVVLRCLAHDPAERYQTADQLAADVDRYLRGEAVSAHPPSRLYAARKFVRRHRGPVAAAAVMLLLLLAGVAGTTVGLVRAEGLRVLAEERADAEANAKAEAEEASRAAEHSRAEAEEAGDTARRRYAEATDAYSKLTYEVQAQLAARPDTQDLRRVLLGYARDGLERQLAESGRSSKPDITLVVSYSQLGELENELGDPVAARRHTETALRLAERVVEQSPDEVAAVGNLIAVLNQLGRLARWQKNLPEAKGFHERAVGEAEGLTERAGNDPRVWNALAISLQGLADVCTEMQDLTAALAQYQRALVVRQRQADERPEDPQAWRELAVAHERVGNTHLRIGDLNAALEHYQVMNGILARVFADSPLNVGYRQDLSKSLTHLGTIALLRKDHAQAKEHFEACLSHCLQMTAADPRNIRISQLTGNCYEFLASVHTSAGQYEEAAGTLTKKLDLYKALVGKHPADRGIQMELARVHQLLARVIQQTDRPADAVAHLVAGVTVYERLAEADRTNVHVVRQVGYAHAALGKAYEQAGDDTRMIEAYQKSLAVAEALGKANPGDKSLRVDVWNAHARLADGYAAAGRLSNAIDQYDAQLKWAHALETQGKLPAELTAARKETERLVAYYRTAARIGRDADLLFGQPAADIPDLAEWCVIANRPDPTAADAVVKRFAEWVAKQPGPRAELEYTVAGCWAAAAGEPPVRKAAAEQALAVLKKLDADGYFTPQRTANLQSDPSFTRLKAYPPFVEWVKERVKPTPREQLPPPRKVE
jgi:tetratricopeptide (TPR) repeat protein